MKIILISGKAGHGKDTLASFMAGHLFWKDKEYKILHFADKLKEVAKTEYKWDGRKNEKGRSLLQELGEKYFDKLGKDYWASKLIEDIKLKYSHKDIIIVPDTRLKEEIQLMQDVFGKDKVITVRIEREAHIGSLTETQKMDISETDLDEHVFDMKVINIDMEDLIYSAGVIINEVV